jgi:DNA-binding IclR family transcriptional regulator
MSARPASQGDVQTLSKTELVVYEAIAIIDKEGHTSTIVDVAHATGLPEEKVRRALDHLVSERHIRASDSGFRLGAHDWSV